MNPWIIAIALYLACGLVTFLVSVPSNRTHFESQPLSERLLLLAIASFLWPAALVLAYRAWKENQHA